MNVKYETDVENVDELSEMGIPGGSIARNRRKQKDALDLDKALGAPGSQRGNSAHSQRSRASKASRTSRARSGRRGSVGGGSEHGSYATGRSNFFRSKVAKVNHVIRLNAHQSLNQATAESAHQVHNEWLSRIDFIWKMLEGRY